MYKATLNEVEEVAAKVIKVSSDMQRSLFAAEREVSHGPELTTCNVSSELPGPAPWHVHTLRAFCCLSPERDDYPLP